MKTNLAIFAIGFATLITLLALVSYASESSLRAVQAGEVKLVCLMKDGERVIPPEMVTGLLDDTWLFKNGYAKRCRIIK